MQKVCSVDLCERPSTARSWCLMHYRRWRKTGSTRGYHDPEIRFFGQVRESDSGCWEWTGAQHEVAPGFTYGRFKHNYQLHMAHRWAYEFLRAEIPDGLVLDHLCRNTLCVNPWHLEPVTQRVNCQRGAGSSTHCPKGHPYDSANTEIHSRGYRQCRACRRDREARYRQRVLAE